MNTSSFREGEMTKSPEIDHSSQDLIDRGRRRFARLPEPVKNFLRPAVNFVLSVGMIVGGMPVFEAHAAAPVVDNSAPKQGNELMLPYFWDHLQVPDKTKEVIEAPLPPNGAGPEMTLTEWQDFLKTHQLEIMATSDNTDEKGNVNEQFTVVQENGKDNIIYKTFKNPETGLFSEYQGISRIPMESVNSVLAMGKVLIAGGGENINSEKGVAKVCISYDAGKTWNQVELPFGPDGPTNQLLKVADTPTGPIVIANNASREDGIGQYLIKLNVDTKMPKILPINWQKDGQPGFNGGSASDLAITKIDNDTHTVEMISAVALNPDVRSGINLLSLNYETGEGIWKNVNSMTIDGTKTSLGMVEGKGWYRDPQNRLHVVASSLFNDTINDVILSEQSATSFNYAHLLDGRGIAGYIENSLFVRATDAILEPDGLHIIMAGGYSTSEERYSILIEMVNGEIKKIVKLLPEAGVLSRGLKRRQISNRNSWEVNIGGSALAVLVDHDPTLRWVDWGLGSGVTPAEPKPTPTPPEARPFKVFLPNLQKSP